MSITCLQSHASIYSQLTPDMHISNTDQRLEKMQVRLHTQTGILKLTIPVHFIDLYLIHFSDYNLEHGLAMVTNLDHWLAMVRESFSLLNLNYNNSFKI